MGGKNESRSLTTNDDKDIAQSLVTRLHDFVMRFDNQKMDNRAEAGDYLRKLITYNRSETVSLMIVGDNQYTVSLDLKSDVGTIQRISNAIDQEQASYYRKYLS